MPARPAPVSAQRVHAFRPTSGKIMGYLGVFTAVVVIALIVATDRNAFGLRAALVAALAGLLAWMTLLRPRVWVHADTLVLRNMASDTYLPLAEVDQVLVRHTLNVWVGDRRFTCLGIGRSSRSMLRSRGGADAAAGSDYVTFVETTIDDLARAARRDLKGEPPPVRKQWAVPELTAVAVLVLALVISIAL